MFSTFTAIFEALSSIDEELAIGVNESQREKLIETLLSLRKTMDKCVQYWLKFEERVNEIQERHSISLPDTLPPGFLEDIDAIDGRSAPDSNEKTTEPEADEGALFLPEIEETEEMGEAEAGGDAPAEEFYRPNSEITANSFRRGLGFWELAMHREAVSEFKKVVEEEPNLLMGHYCLGLSSAQLGQVEEAFKELKLVLALDENKAMRALALNTLGILLAGKEQYSQAQHYFKQATEADPALSEAWFNLGAVNYNLQCYEAAITAFEKAGETAEADWEIALHIGRAWGYLGRYEAAIRNLEQAFRLNPREPVITFELGLVNRLLGRKVQAQCYFHTTLKLMENKG